MLQTYMQGVKFLHNHDARKRVDTLGWDEKITCIVRMFLHEKLSADVRTTMGILAGPYCRWRWTGVRIFVLTSSKSVLIMINYEQDNWQLFSKRLQRRIDRLVNKIRYNHLYMIWRSTFSFMVVFVITPETEKRLFCHSNFLSTLSLWTRR